MDRVQQLTSSAQQPPPGTQRPPPGFEAAGFNAAASTSHNGFRPNPPKNPKLTLDHFDGTNPLDWIFQAEQYFSLHQISVEQLMDYVPFYMRGEALSWFKWMFHNNQLRSCATLCS